VDQGGQVNEIQHNLTNEFLKSMVTKKIINARILDSGCGDGYASQRFIELGAMSVVAHDPFATLPGSTDKIHYKKSYIPLTDDFDIIWSHHVIEHVDNPVDYLQRLGSQLKPNGELWLGCPNSATSAVFADGHIHNFTIANLVLCLQKAGLHVETMSWFITGGQLRIRIYKGFSPTLPRVMRQLIIRNKHFAVSTLPTKLNW